MSYKNEGLVTVAYAMQNAQLTELTKALRKEGYEVIHDRSAGTYIGKLDGRVIFRAMQMGRNAPWIVRADPLLLTPSAEHARAVVTDRESANALLAQEQVS